MIETLLAALLFLGQSILTTYLLVAAVFVLGLLVTYGGHLLKGTTRRGFTNRLKVVYNVFVVSLLWFIFLAILLEDSAESILDKLTLTTS